jgi:hypothetical protein
MNRAPVAQRRHLRRPRRPRPLLPAEREGIKRHQLLLPLALPHVMRLIANARRHGFKVCVGFHPLEGSIFEAAKCRYCSAYFTPWAHGEQRRHSVRHGVASSGDNR